jgi:hypothetical protein
VERATTWLSGGLAPLNSPFHFPSLALSPDRDGIEPAATQQTYVAAPLVLSLCLSYLFPSLILPFSVSLSRYLSVFALCLSLFVPLSIWLSAYRIYSNIKPTFFLQISPEKISGNQIITNLKMTAFWHIAP